MSVEGSNHVQGIELTHTVRCHATDPNVDPLIGRALRAQLDFDEVIAERTLVQRDY